MSERGLLLVLSGPSGVGKGAIASSLLKAAPGLSLSISATTRPPRAGEKDGVNYRFFSAAEFERLIENGQLLEWARVYGNYYGTDERYVEQTLAKGGDLLLEIDIQGALTVKKKKPEATLVFIAPPSRAEQRRRLEGRATDAQPEIERRLANFDSEIKLAGAYDYIVVNDEVPLAVQKIIAVMTAEKQRSHRQLKRLPDYYNGG